MKDDRLENVVRGALEEDRAWDDVTTGLIVDPDKKGEAVIVAKEGGVVSGHSCARKAFELVDPETDYSEGVGDGEPVKRGDEIARVKGGLKGILAAERTALNFLQHLSGIATLTRKYVERVSGRGVIVLDTRKTTPGLRLLEKEAVLHGGGANHRMNLGEMILVKENHIEAAGGFDAMLSALGARVREAEIEVRSLGELMKLSASPPKRVMLDNFTPRDVSKAVDIVRSWCCARPEIEVSGGVTLENIDKYALEGVDFISVGSLTSSAKALDMSLLVVSAG